MNIIISAFVISRMKCTAIVYDRGGVDLGQPRADRAEALRLGGDDRPRHRRADGGRADRLFLDQPGGARGQGALGRRPGSGSQALTQHDGAGGQGDER